METAPRNVSKPEQQEVRAKSILGKMQEALRFRIFMMFPSFPRADKIVKMKDSRAELVSSAVKMVMESAEKQKFYFWRGEHLLPTVLEYLEQGVPFHIEHIPELSHKGKPYTIYPDCAHCSATDPSFRVCEGWSYENAFCAPIDTHEKIIDRKEELRVVPERKA